MPFATKLKITLILTSAWVLGLGGISFYTPALIALQTSFHTSAMMIQLTISYFILGKAISMLVSTPYADRFQRKTLFLLGLFLFTLGSIVCLTSATLLILYLGRFIEGLGVSLCILMGRAIINDQFDSVVATQLFSIIFIGNAIAVTILPILGGYITSLVGWRYIFVGLAVYGFITLCMCWFYLPEKAHSYPSGLTFKYKLTKYCSILTHPVFWAFTLSLSFMDSGEKMLTANLPFFFMQVSHLSPIYFGYLQGSLWCAHLLGLLFCGALVSPYGLKAMVRLGAVFALIAAFLMGLALMVNPSFTSLFFISGAFFYLFSTGFIVTTSLVGIAKPFPNHIGLATALAMTVEFFMGFLLTAVSARHHGQDLTHIIVILMIMSILIFLCWLLLKKLRFAG